MRDGSLTTQPFHPTSEWLDDWAGSLGRWMIFASGLAILVAALLLPASIDLRATRIERDHTLHIERTHQLRIERYQQFLNQLAAPDAHTIDLLAMSQLGMIPADRQAIVAAGQPGDVNLIEFIEPQPDPFVPNLRQPTNLEQLLTSPRWRLWVIAGAAFAVMYGLMPATRS